MASSDSRLFIASIDDATRWGLTWDDLYRELRKLDFETLDQLTEESEFSPAQARAIRTNHPDTLRMLVEPAHHIIGYWSFVPLFPNWYELAVQGRLKDSDITAEKVPAFELGGRFKLYLSMITLAERYRRTGASQLLYDSFLRVLENLAGKGVFFEEVCAVAWSPQGEAVCRMFGLKRVGEHLIHGKVFAGRLLPLPDCSVFKNHPALIDLYEKQLRPNGLSEP
jgi:hypothetical protein